jgi:sec-independent protein translocase protein TatA
MADLGWPEMLIIAVAAMVLFGWKHMPDAARSLGRSIRVFKSEVDAMKDDAVGEPLSATGPSTAETLPPEAPGPHTP